MDAMDKRTHSNNFSKREVEILRGNPFVRSVTLKSVSFTEDFKRLAYKEKCSGVPIADIFRNHGIDPDILGVSRIEGFSYQLNKKARQQQGFADRRSGNYRRPPRTGSETVEQRVRQLENELAYTRQEVEFLKKLQAANMEAQRQWESKHLQK